jgi:lia operon protein LiaG
MSTFIALQRVALAAIAVLATSSSNSFAQEVQRYTLTGSDVAIYNLVGTIKIEGGSGSDVTAEVTRRGPDASRLTVATGKIRGRESLRVKYPSDRIVFSDRRARWGGRTRLRVDDDGTFDSDGDSDRDWGDGRVEIVSSGRGLEAAADVRVMLPRGKRISIHLAAGDATVTNAEGDISVNVYSASVTTSHTRGTLDLDTGSGEVSVADAEGDVTIDSGSGGAELSRIRGEALTIDAGSGSVKVEGATVDRLNIDSGSGGIDLRTVSSPDISLDSGSGRVGMELTSDVSSLRIDSGSGSVTLSVPESLGAELTAETGSGGVDFDFPVTLLKREHGYMRARIGDGQGRITIDSGSGEVRVRRSVKRG